MRWLVICLLALACSRREPQQDQSAPTPQATLPPWFGLPDAPARRIAGRLLEGETPVAGAVVSLRIDVPDPTVWLGMERTTGADGHFDFGEVRAGHYRVLAVATGKSSRLVDVDTTTYSAETLSIYAHACSPMSGTVHAADKPLPRARVDIGGVMLATTDGSGSYTLCLPKDRILVSIRAAGHAAGTAFQLPGVPVNLDEQLMEAITMQGQVIDPDGKPTAGVAVQPVFVEQVSMSHGSAYSDVLAQATTDHAGRFVLHGVAKLDRATSFGDRPAQPAKYHFRILDRDRVFDDWSMEVDASRLPRQIRVAMETQVFDKPRNRDTNATLSGRVMYAGKPLADALVTVPIINYTTYFTRTGPDGTFQLAVHGDGVMTMDIDHASGISTERAVHVTPGKDTKYDVDIAASGRIAGVAYASDGSPLSEATVWIRARDIPLRRYSGTGPDGAFSVEGLEVGHTFDIEIHDGATGTSVAQEVTLDADNPNADGLQLGISEKRAIDGVVVDDRGAAVGGAKLLVTEATFKKLPNGYSTANMPWIPSGVAANTMGAFAGFSHWELGFTTDVEGRFTWSPIQAGKHSIVVIAAGGRVGAADSVDAADSPVRIAVHEPGSIHVVCKNFRPMSEDLGGGIQIISGKRRVTAACDETVGSLPKGRYLLAVKEGRGKYASLDVTVREGRTVEAAMEVKPFGTIRGVAMTYPGGAPVAGVECDTMWPAGENSIGGDPGTITAADGTFELTISRGRVEVHCEGGRQAYARGRSIVDLKDETRTTVHMVKEQPDGIDAGIGFVAEPAGARVMHVAKSASAAGVRPGDLVREADGHSLAGLGPRAMAALAFTLPPRGSVTWTIARGSKSLQITAVDK